MKTISGALAALVICLTVSPVHAIDINPYIKFLIRQEARRQGVDENFCLAVAHIESRIGQQEFRIGLMGKTYYGPFGVHKCFLYDRGWRIDKLETNIKVGVHALRGGFRSLHRYNANCTGAYLSAVRQAIRKYQNESVLR